MALNQFYVTYDFSLNRERCQLPPGKLWVEKYDHDLEACCASPEEAVRRFFADYSKYYSPDEAAFRLAFLRNSHTVGVLTVDKAWRLEGDRLVEVPSDHPDVAEWRGMWADYRSDVKAS